MSKLSPHLSLFYRVGFPDVLRILRVSYAPPFVGWDISYVSGASQVQALECPRGLSDGVLGVVQLQDAVALVPLGHYLQEGPGRFREGDCWLLG